MGVPMFSTQVGILGFDGPFALEKFAPKHKNAISWLPKTKVMSSFSYVEKCKAFPWIAWLIKEMDLSCCISTTPIPQLEASH